MKSTSTPPIITTTTTSKDSFKGAAIYNDNDNDNLDNNAIMNAFAHCMIASISIVVVNYLMSLVMALIYSSTSMTILNRIFLGTSTSIVNRIIHLAIIRWLLKLCEYEQLNITLIIVGPLFGILHVHNPNSLLNLFGHQINFSEQLGFTLWLVLFFVAILIVIVQLRQDTKTNSIDHESGVGQDYFANTQGW